MNDFESVIILKKNCTDEDMKKLLNECNELMNNPTFEDWGMKKLAYPIKNETQGHYIIFNFKIENEKIDKIEEYLTNNEMVLKYIVVKK